MSVMVVLSLSCCTTASINTIDFVEQGADPSGIKPCQATLKRVLSRLGKSEGGSIYFPPGTFLFTERVELPNNIRLVGEGKSTTLKLADSSGRPTRIAKGGFLARGKSDITVEKMSFDLNAGQNFATWLAFRDVKNVKVRDCYFFNSNQAAEQPGWTLHGILCSDVNGAEIINNESTGCQFKLNGGAGYARNMVIRSNRFQNCAQMGVSVVNRIEGGGKAEITNIQIIDNYFERVDDHAIYVGHDHGKEGVTGTMVLDNIQITENTILDPGLYPGGLSSGIFIRMTAASSGVSVRANRILYAGERRSKFSYGIRISGGSGRIPPGFISRASLVENNVLTGGEQAGIQLTGQRNVTLRNNEIRSVSRAIQLRDCQDITVQNNFINEVTTGVELENSGVVKITGNRIRQFSRGIFLLGEASSETLPVSIMNNAFSAPQENGKPIVRRSGNYQIDEGLKRGGE